MIDKTNDIMLALGRLEGKQDALLLSLENHNQRLDKQEERLTGVEKKMAWYLGAASVVSSALAIGVNYLVRMMGR